MHCVRAATTVTNIESTTATLNDIIFPTVYFCNVNQVSKTFLMDIGVDGDEKGANLLFQEFLRGRSNTDLR